MARVDLDRKLSLSKNQGNEGTINSKPFGLQDRAKNIQLNSF